MHADEGGSVTRPLGRPQDVSAVLTALSDSATETVPTLSRQIRLALVAPYLTQKIVGSVYFGRDQMATEWLVAARGLAPAAASLVARVSSDSPLATEERFVQAIARGIAVATHAALHAAHDRGRALVQRSQPGEVRSSIEAAIRWLSRRISETRDHVNAGDRVRLVAVGLALSEWTFETGAALLEAAGSVDDEGWVSLEASALARRVTMVAAASVLLAARLGDERKASAARKAAGEVTEIVRTRRMRMARRTLRSAPSAPLAVTGRLVEVKYIARPDRPSTIGRLDTGIRIEAPYRSLTARGFRPGSRVWLWGKVAGTGLRQAVLEIDRDSPTEHADQVWEDWLAVQVRKAYDLRPGELHAEWEFPSLRLRYGPSDLLCRLA